MKKLYKVTSEEGQAFVNQRQALAVELGDETEIELTMDEEKALIAAGWIEGPIEEKKKGAKS